ncbi:F-box protein At-B [Acorus gramineus]|uniref:F-box protein At-B n=1 Tax=Acorus gramineus TaxID=55184 RepID=A0AAV9A444_ACOGR|nr:F-box protein At-B [Acorus gramineus]
MMLGGRNGGLESLPKELLHEILSKLDVMSLCSASPVSRTLRSSVTHALSTISTLDLSEFSPDVQILSQILNDNIVLKCLTLDCWLLCDVSITIFSRQHLVELVLLRCTLFSSRIFTAIGENCPNLRQLTMEMACDFDHELPHSIGKQIMEMLKGCMYLEHLSLNFKEHILSPVIFNSLDLTHIQNLKVLQLNPASEQQITSLMQSKRMYTNTGSFPAKVCNQVSVKTMYLNLQSLSLVLNRITDKLIISITKNLPHLIELYLEDRPDLEPLMDQDLTNHGLLLLCSLEYLTRLSLTRSKQYYPATFKWVNDMGIFFLAETFRGLQSVKMAGFSRVTDAGYSSILQSCSGLQKFEIINPVHLSDLTFHNVVGAASSLIEVRIACCDIITDDTVGKLSTCRNLEVLDLWGCKSIGSYGLGSIANLEKLTKLNLCWTAITNSDLSFIGNANAPISSLCLRACKRVSDEGIASLLRGKGTISKTLLSLDLGFIEGLSDRAIFTIVEFCREITDLCVRCCFSITDASIEGLGRMEGFEGKRSPLRRLDVYRCRRLSHYSLKMLRRPYFPGLRWIGIGQTGLSLAKGEDGLSEISGDRPWLHICSDGCEMGCNDGWQFPHQL